jgi:hypothetical protein
VLIELFRDERTDNRELTMDVTGRNIPPVTSSTVWLFVGAIDIRRLPLRWDTAYLRYAVRQVVIRTGTTYSNANLLMRWISVRAVVSSLNA